MRIPTSNTPRASAFLTGTAAVLLLLTPALSLTGCAGSRSPLGEPEVSEKLDLRLRQSLDPGQEGEELGEWIQVIVRLTHTASAEDQEALEEYGRVQSMVDRFVTLRLPKEEVLDMAAEERVAHVELSMPAVAAPVPPPAGEAGRGNTP
ncbi:MAG: hypothetical protein R6W82_08710 [bacterium]